jgi:hypothetical protein
LLRGADVDLSAADLAAIIPIVAAPAVEPVLSKPASPKPAKTPTPPLPDTPPPWPPDGYAGAAPTCELEKAERDFIISLAAPLDLERLLDRATNYAPRSTLSARDIETALAAFVQEMRQFTEERFATFAQAEATFRSADADACSQRLARLRWEADAYLGRLATAKQVLVLRLQERERRDYERAYAAMNAAVGDLARRAELRSSLPPYEERGPRSILRKGWRPDG